MEKLDAIAQSDGGKDKSAEHLAALDGMVAAGDLAGCKAFVDHGAPPAAAARPPAPAALPPPPPLTHPNHPPPKPCPTPCPSC